MPRYSVDLHAEWNGRFYGYFIFRVTIKHDTWYGSNTNWQSGRMFLSTLFFQCFQLCRPLRRGTLWCSWIFIRELRPHCHRTSFTEIFFEKCSTKCRFRSAAEKINEFKRLYQTFCGCCWVSIGSKNNQNWSKTTDFRTMSAVFPQASSKVPFTYPALWATSS